MKKLVLFFAALLLAESYQAQAFYNDAQGRASLSLNKRFKKTWGIHLDQQYRANQNFGNFYRAAYDVGVSYRFAKFFRLRADYVYILRKNRAGSWNSRQWFYVAGVLKLEKDRWSFYYRNMFQARGGNRNSDMAETYRLYDRNKITVRHETTKRLSPWIAGEAYVALNSPFFKGVDRVRGQVGLTIKTWKKQSIDLYFMYQAFLVDNQWFDPTPRINSLPRRDFIYGFDYNIDF